jgi:Xaa-Pro aminopeptidase
VRAVAEAALETVKASGIPDYERPHVGHGVGLELYEWPLVTSSERDRLEEGMVLNIELPYAIRGVGGLQIEETIVVRADGYELLTAASRSLYRSDSVIRQQTEEGAP